jgi:Fe2+ transport system protein FeoA
LERRRLQDLGFLPGAEIQAEFVSPGADPVAYRIREAIIALRRDQADQILIDRLEDRT